MEDTCIECDLSVRLRQQGISCDLCERWQNRTCNSGVSQAEYKRACKGEPLHFICRDCFTPVHQSTALQGSSLVHSDVDAEMPDVSDVYSSMNSVVDAEMPDVSDVYSSVNSVVDAEMTDVQSSVNSDVDERRNATTRWRCSVRNKSQVCVAVVTEQGGTYNPASKAHSHPPDATKPVASAALTKAKAEGVLNPYTSAKTKVVESVRGAGPCVDYDQLARRVNRAREATRPEVPTDLNFELNSDAIPDDFMKRDLVVDDRRHIVFAKETQLKLLAESKMWYMDGTFKSMRKPFEMLFTIHAFVRRGTNTNQVPLVYVLMSGKRAKDYASVLVAIRSLLEVNAVQQIVVDFEAAIWKACREVFPGVRMKGCAFHWDQAVFRHVQSLGLTTEYMSETGTYAFIRQMLCLPLLPAEHIRPTFDMMSGLNTAPHITPLLEYMSNTWINSTVWPVESWSVYGQTVRTNNDVEGDDGL